MKNIIYSIATGALAFSPFVIDTPAGKLAAIFGLTTLTFQAIELKAWNLVILNTIGVMGYTWSILA